jgi:phosphoribosyl 1,2-cyclic phosphodiesterase
MQFTVLASGSGGNASLLQVDGFGLLLDAGLGPRALSKRLAKVGAAWDNVHAVLLTHTHTDHWRERIFAHLLRCGIPLYCHPDHHGNLNYSKSFAKLRAEKLVHEYDAGREYILAQGFYCRPLRLRHDCPTFGFRFEFFHAGGACLALAYAADLGCWDSTLVAALADVDLLALEFNHDVKLERASGRSPRLIARVLSEHGHLSNTQAAGLLKAILQRSAPGRLQHVVQLHLSRDCNRPEMARAAARLALADVRSVELHTASQHDVSPTCVVAVRRDELAEPAREHSAACRGAWPEFRRSIQRFLPGMG